MIFAKLYKNPVGSLFAFLAVVGLGSFAVLPMLATIFSVTSRTKELVFVVTWVLGCLAGFLCSILYLRELAVRVRVSKLIFILVPSIFAILCLMIFIWVDVDLKR